MEFQKKKAIYLQIAEFVCDQIILDKWMENKKIPSIRDLAVMLEVNPNTTTRAYSHLESLQVIRMERGIGFFVADHARTLVIEYKKQAFLKEDLPLIFKNMRALNISFSELKKYYEDAYHENE